MSNEKREKQMMTAADKYAEEVGYKDEHDLCSTLNVFCAGWRAADNSRWIPVEERLPKERGQYFVYTAAGQSWQSEWMQDFKGVWRWYASPVVLGIIANVTHWMPLPTPPQRKEY